MNRKPKWHDNPKTAAEVIESLQSLGYIVTTDLPRGSDPAKVAIFRTARQRARWRAIKKAAQ